MFLLIGISVSLDEEQHLANSLNFSRQKSTVDLPRYLALEVWARRKLFLNLPTRRGKATRNVPSSGSLQSKKRVSWRHIKNKGKAADTPD